MQITRAERVQRFLSELTAWARSQPDARGLALVGSYARSQAREDSDVDVILLTTQPQRYLEDLTWLARFGEVRERGLEDYGKVISVRVLYGDGLEVEYGITGEEWAALPLDDGTREVISNGMVVLFEQGDLLSRHLPGHPLMDGD